MEEFIMEKLRLNNKEFELEVMGIHESDASKVRSFVIVSELHYEEIKEAFKEVSEIEHLSESGDILRSYFDGVAVKTIEVDFEKNTYTITISTDSIVSLLKQMQTKIDELTKAK
jgi:hypothetical protein